MLVDELLIRTVFRAQILPSDSTNWQNGGLEIRPITSDYVIDRPVALTLFAAVIERVKEISFEPQAEGQLTAQSRAGRWPRRET